ncbi:MAG: SH3 domain-containing protein [Anaerolineae bacterium]|nr:SH3 domain-containing protein [Anaerolineae bacterium]
MQKRLLPIMITLVITLLGVVWVMAQDGAECTTSINQLWTVASDACIKQTIGFICNGGSPPQVEPAGPVSNALNPVGALVDVSVVDAMRTPLIASNGAAGGLVWLRPAAPIRYTGLLVGDVTVFDNTPEGFPSWQASIVITSSERSGCAAAPRSAYALQTPFGEPTSVAINGVSIGLNGTLIVETTADQTIFANLSGQSSLYAVGQEVILRPGEQTTVLYSPGNFSAPIAPPALSAPLDGTLIQNFPVALLDRPIILPQPGFVATDGAVNLRVSPSTDAAVIVQVPGGQVLSVLGKDSSGQWYHVRLDSGETGWMFAELLIQNVGSIQTVYDATPLPPQRYGELGRTGKVVAPAGVNMRQAPDVTFPLVMTVPDGARVTLLARSPYSPWLKVDFNGIIGWLAIITLETQAVLEALPIDYNVPPPPEPTRIPGSFGNAFPDPNRGG